MTQRRIVAIVVGLISVVAMVRLMPRTRVFRGPGVATIALQADRNDLGRVLPGESAETHFHYSNVGDATLILAGITTSCGCTAATTDRTVLPPGERGSIRVSFQVPLNANPIAHSISFETNDPVHKQIQLLVVAQPEWPVAVAPESVHLVPIVQGSAATVTVELYTPSGRTFHVSGVETSDAWITVRQVGASGRRYSYSVSATPSQLGPFERYVKFHTDVDRRQTVTLPISGHVVLPSPLTPTRLLLGWQAAGSESNARLALTKRAEDVGITDVRISSPLWKILGWSATNSHDAKAALTLRVRVPSTEGYHHADIEILCRVEPKEISVPISCVVHADGSVASH
jgi:hypothetical protein